MPTGWEKGWDGKSEVQTEELRSKGGVWAPGRGEGVDRGGELRDGSRDGRGGGAGPVRVEPEAVNSELVDVAKPHKGERQNFPDFNQEVEGDFVCVPALPPSPVRTGSVSRDW